jgi:hypothetical protein
MVGLAVPLQLHFATQPKIALLLAGVLPAGRVHLKLNTLPPGHVKFCRRTAIPGAGFYAGPTHIRFRAV